MCYVLFCLVCYGITVNIVYSMWLERITNRSHLQFFNSMFDCVKCTAFWVGVFLCLILAIFSASEIPFFRSFSVLGPWQFGDALWAGFLSSSTCWLIDGFRPGNID